MLERGIVPVVPAQGSVGASGDLAPLAHMTAVMIGVGDAWVQGELLPAPQALAVASLTPIELGPKEGLALLNGTQFSTAHALAAPSRGRNLGFRSTLVTGALATDAARGSDAPSDPCIHALRKHRGQIEVAEALRALMRGSAIRASSTRRRRTRAGPLLPALSAASDGRGPGRIAAGSSNASRR